MTRAEQVEHNIAMEMKRNGQRLPTTSQQARLREAREWAAPKVAALTLKPCPEEPEHLCCYPACNCAMQRLPAE